MLAWLILAIVALAGLFFAVENHGLAHLGLSATTIIVSIIGALVGLYLVTSRSHAGEDTLGRSKKIKAIAFVGLAAAGFAGLYVYGNLEALLPREREDMSSTQATPRDARIAVRLRRDASGRFTTRALINGAAVDMIVDTGATQVLLRSSDAQAAGIDIDKLPFDTAISTANGTTYTAPSRLRTVQIGLLQIDDIDVLVAKPGTLNESLLGMSFLTRLTSYDLVGEFLTLRN